MREPSTKSARNGSNLKSRAFTIFLAVLVLATQVLIVLNLRNYFYSENDGGGGGGQENTASSLAASKIEAGKSKLKPLRVDMARFEIEVIKPHRDMKSKFPNHPDMIISKLFKILRKEENKTATLLNKVHEMRTRLGFEDDLEQQEGNAVDVSEKPSVMTRKLKSLNEDEELCPKESPYLLGPLYVKQKDIPDLEAGSTEFEERFSANLEVGGKWRPRGCRARTKLAVIIPYRNREAHLKMFLYHMHPIFQRQLLDYQIFVIEQSEKEDFNRGALMNIGYKEALKRYDFNCFAIHDVDLVPEDDRNLYECPAAGPKHMSVAVNKWKYRLQYQKYFGGVTTLSRDQYKKINGFANLFYGWGGEDDDLSHRVQKHNLTIQRSPANIARFSMLKHDKVSMNDDLENLMEKSKKSELDTDGLTTLKYKIVDHKDFPLYTWIKVDLPKGPGKRKKSWFEGLRDKVLDGVNSAAGGLAKSVANHAIKFAGDRDEAQEAAKNHIY